MDIDVMHGEGDSDKSHLNPSSSETQHQSNNKDNEVMTNGQSETQPEKKVAIKPANGNQRRKPCLKLTITPSTPPAVGGPSSPNYFSGSSSAHAMIKMDQIKFTSSEGEQSKDKEPLAPIRKKPREYKLKAFLIILFVIMVTGISAIVHFYNKQQSVWTLRGVVFDSYYRNLVISRNSVVLLQGELGKYIGAEIPSFDCTEENDETTMCLKWKNQGHIQIQKQNLSSYGFPSGSDSSECYSVQWIMDHEDWPHSYDCFSMEGAYWYGGSLFHSQKLALGNISFPLTPYVSGTVHDEESFGPVLDRFWFSSNGISISVDDSSPLHVSINAPVKGKNKTDNMLCLYADYENSPYQNTHKTVPYLAYNICVAENVRSVRQLLSKTYIDGSPLGTSFKKEVFSEPVWSTWAFFKENITDEKLVGYANDIVNNQYGHVLLNIDDGWQDIYGHLQFDKLKFPDSDSTLQNITNLLFDITMWVHPYLSTESNIFYEAITKGMLVRDQSGLAPGLVRWFNGPATSRWDRGVAGVIDMHKDGKQWFGNQLLVFQQRYPSGFVDGFRFDMGEVDMLPYMPLFKDSYPNPNYYTQAYLTSATQGKFEAHLSQVRVGYKTQHIPAFMRIYDKNSTWGYDNGIKTVIPTVLTLGLLGYPFIMPDTIGGSAYEGYPTEELYIRWLQLTTFLPIMHFSIPPHQYSSKTVQIAKDMVRIHKEIVFPVLLHLLVTNDYPLIKPLWWMAPEDPATWWIEDEFLVGEVLLVAPILNAEQTVRDVYLPAGKWRDQIDNILISGPVWMKKTVPLEKIAYFVKDG